MKLLFSNPLELGRTGAGRPYGYLHDYLMRQNRHEVKFIGGVELVRRLYSGVPTPPESLEHGQLSDLLASFEDLDCNVFLGAGCASLSQIREIRYKRGSTMHSDGSWSHKVKCITTWFSSHYAHAQNVLATEYQTMGIQGNAIDPYLIWRDQWEHKWSDALIVPSESCRETYEADPVCKGKVHVVNFGVDSQRFHPSDRHHDEFRVLFAGGNWIRKGLYYLIKAWNQAQLHDGVLTVLGVANPPIGTWRASYAGWVPDDQVPGYYQSNTIFCLPSLEEGQALAVLEAMASGIPVIYTRETGAPIEDGKEGLIVPSRDINKLKDAIKSLHDNPDEVKRMGKNARAKAESMTWELFGQRVLEVCEAVASI